jgi:hypothetical protein
MDNFDLEKFKEFVSTYDQQTGHENYSVETVLNDFLYGIGICIDEDFEGADGFKRFKGFLIKHLEAVPESSLPKKCYCGKPVDESNIDCVAYNLCKDHAMDC